jgi:hypothetical protein
MTPTRALKIKQSFILQTVSQGGGDTADIEIKDQKKPDDPGRMVRLF